MRRIWLISLSVAVGVSLASVALAQEPPKPPAPSEKPPRALPTLLVFDLIAEKGVEAGHMSTLTEIVIDKVSKTKKYQVVGQKDLDKMLFWEQNKQLKGCTDTACLVQIAGALGAQYYIEGSVGGLASNYYITLKLIEAQSVKVLERSTEKVGRDEQALARGIVKVTDTVLGIKNEEPPPPAAPAAAAKIVSGPPETFDKKFWGQVGVYSGIGFVVLGSVSWALAKKADDDYKAAGSTSAMEDLASKNDTYNTLKLTGFIVGGLLAATGGVLWYMGANEKTSAALNVTPVLTPDVAAIQVGGAW
jgi:TolB-like protein